MSCLFLFFIVINGQAGEKFKLIAFPQIPLLNYIADAFNGPRSLYFSLYFGLANIECESLPVFMYRLDAAFVAQCCNKYQNNSYVDPNIYVLLRRKVSNVS